MKKINIYIIISLITIIWPNPIYLSGEELSYLISFRFFPAGNAKLSILPDNIENKSIYLLSISIQTNSFLDKFYKIREKSIYWINSDNFSLIKTNKNVQQGNYIKEHSAFTIGDSLLYWNENIIKIDGPVYEPIAFIYFLRTQDLSLGNSFNFYSAGEKKIKEVKVNVTGIENIKSPAGLFNCLKIEPTSIKDKSLTKNHGDMNVWLTNDEYKYPVKIEIKTNVGLMTMKLYEI